MARKLREKVLWPLGKKVSDLHKLSSDPEQQCSWSRQVCLGNWKDTQNRKVLQHGTHKTRKDTSSTYESDDDTTPAKWTQAQEDRLTPPIDKSSDGDVVTRRILSPIGDQSESDTGLTTRTHPTKGSRVTRFDHPNKLRLEVNNHNLSSLSHHGRNLARSGAKVPMTDAGESREPPMEMNPSSFRQSSRKASDGKPKSNNRERNARKRNIHVV